MVKVFFKISVFCTAISLFIVFFFPTQNVLALPFDCNYDQNAEQCCTGKILNCTDPVYPLNKWCSGMIAPIGACPY